MHGCDEQTGVGMRPPLLRPARGVPPMGHEMQLQHKQTGSVPVKYGDAGMLMWQETQPCSAFEAARKTLPGSLPRAARPRSPWDERAHPEHGGQDCCAGWAHARARLGACRWTAALPASGGLTGVPGHLVHSLPKGEEEPVRQEGQHQGADDHHVRQVRRRPGQRAGHHAQPGLELPLLHPADHQQHQDARVQEAEVVMQAVQRGEAGQEAEEAVKPCTAAGRRHGGQRASSRRALLPCARRS